MSDFKSRIELILSLAQENKLICTDVEIKLVAALIAAFYDRVSANPFLPTGLNGKAEVKLNYLDMDEEHTRYVVMAANHDLWLAMKISGLPRSSLYKRLHKAGLWEWHLKEREKLKGKK